jgi:spermidine/putrescine-binding protein
MKGIFSKRKIDSSRRRTALISASIVLCVTALCGCPLGGNQKEKLSDTLTILNWEDYIEMGVSDHLRKNSV